MTPEERLRRLKDRDRWAVDGVVPRAEMSSTGRVGRIVVPLVAGIVAVGVAAALVVGVVTLRDNRAVPPAITHTSSEAPTPAPTFTDSPAVVPSPEQPESRLGLSCAQLVSTADVSALLDTQVNEVDTVASSLARDWYIPDQTTVIEAGGLECEWSNAVPTSDISGTVDDYVGLRLTVTPDPDKTSNALDFVPGQTGYCGAPNHCNADYRIGSTVVDSTADGGAAGDSAVRYRALLAAVNDVLRARGTPVPFVKLTSTPLPVSCAGYIGLGQISAVLGVAMTTDHGDFGRGDYVGVDTAGLVGYRWCAWKVANVKDAVGVQIIVEPGAGWAVDYYAEVGSPQGVAKKLDVTGLRASDVAYSRCTNHDRDCVVDLSLGGNWIEFRGGSELTAGRGALRDVAAAVVANVR